MDDREAGLSLAERFTRVATRDLHEAGPMIERLQGGFIARPHCGSGLPEEAVHVRAAACGNVAISTFKFGRPLDIVPQGLAGAVLVTTAISGRAGLEGADGRWAIRPGASFISQQEHSPTFSYDVDTEVLKLRFDRHRLEELRFKMEHRASGGQLCFERLMSQPGAGLQWVTLLRFVVATLNASQQRCPSSREMACMEEMLMLTLLNVQPCGGQADMARRGATVSPRQFHLAVDYLHHHLMEEIRLSDIAAAASCSIRSLARAFNQACDTTPMQYLLGLRLERVKAELLHPASDARTVADIAFHWGFRHLGEFNRKYRATFGQTPSETRQRARLPV